MARKSQNFMETEPSVKSPFQKEKKILQKISQFHLISFCGNFVERHSTRKVSGESPKLCGYCASPQNFHIRKLGGITVVYIVKTLVVTVKNYANTDLKNFSSCQFLLDFITLFLIFYLEWCCFYLQFGQAFACCVLSFPF